MSEAVDLYDNVYSDFASAAEAAVRRQAFGEDIGQSSWLTAADWLRFADLVQIPAGGHVLEVGSGSGGPAVYLASARDCRVTGIDLNEHGVRNAERLAAAKSVSDRVRFQVADAGQPLPFPPSSFDAVLSNDAMCHIPDRQSVLSEFHRVLRPGRHLLFTDAMIVTGLVSQEELAVRSSIGWYLFAPPGENERLIERAGFKLRSSTDVTDAAELISERWHAAREQHRDETAGAGRRDELRRPAALSGLRPRLSSERRCRAYVSCEKQVRAHRAA